MNEDFKRGWNFGFIIILIFICFIMLINILFSLNSYDLLIKVMVMVSLMLVILRATVYRLYLFIFHNNAYRVIMAIKRCDKASKNRIKQTQLRIFVEQNEHINLINYWYYRYFTKEWRQIKSD